MTNEEIKHYLLTEDKKTPTIKPALIDCYRMLETDIYLLEKTIVKGYEQPTQIVDEKKHLVYVLTPKIKKLRIENYWKK